MKYDDGTEARMGDRVLIRNGDTGVIVFSIDTDEFSPEYPKEKWADLKTGIMVLTDKGALVHLEDPLSPSLLVRAPGKTKTR